MYCACWIVDNVGPHHLPASATTSWATFVAPLVAVGLEAFAVLRERLRRPKLSLKFDPTPGQNDYLTEVEVPGGGARYVRMRIANKKGRDTAHGVEVLLDSVVHLDSGSRRFPGGYAFMWSNAVKDDGRPRTQMNIASGVARHFDILCVVGPRGASIEPDDRTPKPAFLKLEISPLPAGKREYLSERTFELKVVVPADNCDTSFATLHVKFDGSTAYGERIREWTGPRPR